MADGTRGSRRTNTCSMGNSANCGMPIVAEQSALYQWTRNFAALKVVFVVQELRLEIGPGSEICNVHHTALRGVLFSE